jgi:hypothetical protein
MSRASLVVLLLAAALAAGGCGGARASTAGGSGCPAAWQHGWQQLANRIHAAVYCPRWMPQPLDARIHASDSSGPYVNHDRSYLVPFLYMDPSPSSPYEVHVNFRGYPGRTSIPTCEDTLTAGKKVVHPKVPCFADPRGHKRFGSTAVTVYTANQGADAWHVLYAWRSKGSLYTVSEHVITPYTYTEVVKNLDRIMRSLVVVRPTR